MMLTLAEFEDGLDRHGALIERWPAELQEPAHRLCAEDVRARAMLDREARLQALLDEAAAVQPVSSAQLGRLMSSLEARRRPVREFFPLMGTPRNLFAALGLAVFIFTCGGWTGSVVAQDDAEHIELAALDVYTSELVIEP